MEVFPPQSSLHWMIDISISAPEWIYTIAGKSIGMSSARNTSEKAVEDVLAKYLDISEEVLNRSSGSLKLQERQETLPGGRIDLLYSTASELLLVELKVTPGSKEHLDQLEDYKQHYENNIIGNRYPEGYDLVPILLAPKIPENIERYGALRGISTIEYSIDEVFSSYEDHYFASIDAFELKPVSTGVDSFHLTNGLIRYLGDSAASTTVKQCAQDSDEIGKQPNWDDPEDRVRKLVRLCVRLNLIYLANKRQSVSGPRNVSVSMNDELSLTETGLAYLDEMDSTLRVPHLNVPQADIIVELLYDQPFYSKVTAGLLILLDTILDLTKTTERVTTNDLVAWYPKKAGKQWSDRTSKDLVRWYGNYLNELGLIAKIQDQHSLTPKGMNLVSYHSIEIGKEMIRSG